MTSRPPAGIQRQPQRSLSGTGIIQRHTPQRALSQQYPSSTTNRKPDNFVDLTVEAPDTGRYGSSRLGGSRLKVELGKVSTDAFLPVESPKTAAIAPSSQAARGRPRLRFEEDHPQLQVVHDSTVLSSIRGVDNTNLPISMPMPRRPVHSAPPFARGERTSTATTMKKDIRPKPYVLEVPSSAPHYHPNGYADFFPWTGDHPEDQFTDHVIRQGFFDKSQTTQNETGSAKQSIFPAVKHRSGLQTLSSLFTGVLLQRRTHGQITSAPTFKPPPRVTLTDTKRETWLRDLANPSISLRRLSRTIPHGIRGKVLLEQCLSKRIPTERAVWLVKCVGANEIRAFKRKGVTGTFAMGGEAKWIRDWTVFVEQFVEVIIAFCGENDWKARVLYAIRLAAHLYSEHLLDREHYMDWLSMSLESCPLSKAPIWLLITQVYWNELLSFRKYGRRLVTAICAHLHSAHDSLDQDLLTPLTERLTVLLKRLMETHGESFISPKVWVKYSATLASYLTPDGQNQSPAYRSIDRRNERLYPTRTENPSPRRRVIELLDTVLSRPFSPGLFRGFQQTMGDLPSLARTLLDWSTSPHRPGTTKVYVAARMLRACSKSGIDLNEAVLDFLGSVSHTPGLCRPSLYHLVCELTRSGHFSISKYLQWLIARGGVQGPADLAEDGPYDTRLLAELPIHEIPDSIERLRRTMLSRASSSFLSHESQQTRAQILLLENCLYEAGNSVESDSGYHAPTQTADAGTERPSLSRATKSEIGVWVRKRVALFAVPPTTVARNDWAEEKPTGSSSAITCNEFNVVRTVLEDIEDLSMLADVLRMVTHSDDPHVLASVADTLCFHVQAFAAIGALQDIFDELLLRLRSLPEDSDLTALQRSLFHLARRLPGTESTTLQLSQEFIQSNQRTAADACSPVSDHMVEMLDDSESQFSDEIEKLLTSGTSMDDTTLERLFERIILRIEASWTKNDRKVPNCATFLTRLKYFGAKQFELLIAAWLRRLFRTSKRPSLAYVLGPLISVDCLTFKYVIESSAAVLESNLTLTEPSIASKLAVETLALLLGTSREAHLMAPDDWYHLGIRRLCMQIDHPNETLSVIRRAIDLSTPTTEHGQESLVSLCRSDRMHKLLQQVVVNDLETVVRGLIVPLASSPRSESRAQLSDLFKSLLEPDICKHTQDQTVAYRVEHTLHLADDLTLPFCQLELQLISTFEIPDLANEDNDGAEYLEAFERAVDLAVASNNRSWTSIIPALDIQIARHLCQRAERLLLQLIPSIRAEDLNMSTSVDNDELAKRLLFIVDATTYSMRDNRTSQLAVQIVEKLNDIWQIISQGYSLLRTAIIENWLPLMLDFITLHADIFDSKTGSELRSRILLSLSALLLELQTHAKPNALLIQQIFDVALLLADDLPEDARLSCVRSLRDKTSDPRIRYIFGFSIPSMEWLQLNHKGKLVPFALRRWEILSEPTPNVGENDTSLSLTLFGARKE